MIFALKFVMTKLKKKNKVYWKSGFINKVNCNNCFVYRFSQFHNNKFFVFNSKQMKKKTINKNRNYGFREVHRLPQFLPFKPQQKGVLVFYYSLTLFCYFFFTGAIVIYFHLIPFKYPPIAFHFHRWYKYGSLKHTHTHLSNGSRCN